jgi:hypothetical protein
MGSLSEQLLAALAIRSRAATADICSLDLKLEAKAQLHFSKQYLAKAHQVESQLAPYFELEHVPDKRISLHTLRHRAEPCKELADPAVHRKVLPTLSRALRGHWKRHTCENILGALQLPAKSFVRSAVAMEGLEAVQGKGSLRELEQVEAFFCQHERMRAYIDGLPSRNVIELVAATKQLAKERGLRVVGILENLGQLRQSLYEALLSGVPAAQAITDALDAYVADMRRRTNEPCFQAIVRRGGNLDSGGYRFKALLTPEALLAEGERMHHCVGGYVGEVLEGRSRIIAMVRPRAQDSLTLEYVLSSKLWAPGQCRGLMNRAATATELAAVLDYTLTLNMREVLFRLGMELPNAVLKGAVPVVKVLGLDRFLTVERFSRKRMPLRQRAKLWAMLKAQALKRKFFTPVEDAWTKAVRNAELDAKADVLPF